MSNCVHYWIIEPALKRVSPGRCVKCLAVKEFINSTPEPEMWPGSKTLKEVS